MAPKGGGGKGGGGGGGKSSSASCPECLSALQLSGNDWKHNISTALFAINVIVALILLACIIVQTRFKWVRDNLGPDKLRNKGYYYAATSMLIYYILYIVDHVLGEESHTTTRLYYLLYIFTEFFMRIGEILILAIIFRTIAESSLANLARKLSIVHKILIGLLGTASFAVFVLFTTTMAYRIRNAYYGMPVYQAWEYSSLVYQVLYLVAALLAGVESLTVMLRARSKPALLTLVIVTPALILHAIFALAYIGLTMSSTRRNTISSYTDLRIACLFIIDMANGFIFAGVVAVGWLAHKRGKGGKYANRGAGGGADETQYRPVGGWGA